MLLAAVKSTQPHSKRYGWHAGLMKVLMQPGCNVRRFSYDAMLDLKGNTAVYLLYAHARIASIVKKAETTKGVNVTSLIGKHPIQVGC